MDQLFYFRKLYEYQNNNEDSQIIKNFINGAPISIIPDLCTGKLPLPSPFLLDEIEWSLNNQDDRVKEIIYQLKVISRKFYASLAEFESGQYNTHFTNVSASLGQQMVCYLIELRLYNTGHNNAIVNKVKIVLYKTFLFFAYYPNIFRGLYGTCSMWSLATLWDMRISLELTTTFSSFLLASIICIISIIGGFTLEKKLNHNQLKLVG